MTDKEFQDIMKNASDKTLEKFSGASPLTQNDMDRIFKRSMQKLHEKEQNACQVKPDTNAQAAVIGFDRSDRIRTQNTEKIQEEIGEAPRIKRSSFRPMIAAAASFMLILGGVGMMLFNSNKGVDTNRASAKSSSPESKRSAVDEPVDSKERDDHIIPIEDTDESQDTQTESETDSSSKISTDPVMPDDVSETDNNDDTGEIVDDGASYDVDSSSAEQDPSSDDIRDSQRDEQVRAAVDTLDKQIEIAYGGRVDIRVKYDSDFELTDDPAATAYYLIPDDIRSDYENFDSTMRSGPFTDNFLMEQGLDDISERIAEHDGAMLFKREYCRATRPLYYSMLDKEIYSGQDADSCYVNVFDGIDSYQLNFVYDANTSKWKMDSMH